MAKRIVTTSENSTKDPKSKKKGTVVHNHIVNIDTLEMAEMKEYLAYLSSPKTIFWTNFWAGTSKGLGFVIGTVIVITVVMFILGKVLSEIPWMGELFRWLDDWLRENLKSYSQNL